MADLIRKHSFAVRMADLAFYQESRLGVVLGGEIDDRRLALQVWQETYHSCIWPDRPAVYLDPGKRTIGF